MRRVFRRRPSPAMIVALIALFISLAANASALPGVNTVFSDDIVDGQVSRADIGEDAIGASEAREDTDPGGGFTGSQVNEATLAEVPRARRSASAASADEAGTAAFATRAQSAGTARRAQTAAKADEAATAGVARRAQTAAMADEAATAGVARRAQTAARADESDIAGNADLLDGLDSSAFLRIGDPAGGALTGHYPNPGIALPARRRVTLADDWEEQFGFNHSPYTPQVVKDLQGVVHLYGEVTARTVVPRRTILRLPEEYRPPTFNEGDRVLANAVSFSRGFNRLCVLRITGDGIVAVEAGCESIFPRPVTISLDGVSFLAAPTDPGP